MLLDERSSSRVDVEGAEREVLASSDWNVFRPIVVVVEAVAPWSTKPTHEAWEPLLLGAEYALAAFDGINRFYVDRGRSDLILALVIQSARSISSFRRLTITER